MTEPAATIVPVQPTLRIFLCERLHTRLTRPACAARWQGANADDGPPELTRSACNGCPLGEEHSKGRPYQAKSPAHALVDGTEVRILTREERNVAQTFRELASSDRAWRERTIPLLAFLARPRTHAVLVEWARVTGHGTQHLTDLLAWTTTEGLVTGNAVAGWRLAAQAAAQAAEPEPDPTQTPAPTERTQMAGPPKTAASKTCAKCHEDYTPTGNRQKYCSDCSKKPSRAKTARIERIAAAAKKAAPRAAREVRAPRQAVTGTPASVVEQLIKTRDELRADADAIDRVLRRLGAEGS